MNEKYSAVYKLNPIERKNVFTAKRYMNKFKVN